VIGDVFSNILPMVSLLFDVPYISHAKNKCSQGCTVNETQEFRKPFEMHATTPSAFELLVIDIICYRGKKVLERSTFMDNEPKMFSTLCFVKADISHVKTRRNIAPHSLRPYHTAKYDVIFSFGLTELKAYISWEENGIEKRSPAQVVYDPDAIILDES